MARHRQPREKAKANGAFDEHPGRYGEEEPPKHSEPLGDPPKFLTAAQKKLWLEIADCGLPGVFTKGDRLSVEQAVLLLAEVRDAEKHNKTVPRQRKAWNERLKQLEAKFTAEKTATGRKAAQAAIKNHHKIYPLYQRVPTARLQLLRGYFATFGMNPTDRQRLRVPELGDKPGKTDGFIPLH